MNEPGHVHDWGRIPSAGQGRRNASGRGNWRCRGCGEMRRYTVRPRQQGPWGFNRREWEVVRLRAMGHSRVWIATYLGLTHENITAYLARARAKVGLELRSFTDDSGIIAAYNEWEGARGRAEVRL